MLNLIYQGQYGLVAIIVFALVFSLSFHEFGHAYVAKLFGDRTAEQQGRLTLNPIAHIDPMGLLMVILIGFGYAKPVPTNPRNFSSPRADLWVSAAGPGMNLLLAIVAANFYGVAINMGWEIFLNQASNTFFSYFIIINLVLMLFNLIPIGPLDGHYILPHFLPKPLAYKYRIFNHQYGTMILLGLIALSFIGVPVFSYVFAVGQAILPWITWI
jgi:Zn-dependent protease